MSAYVVAQIRGHDADTLRDYAKLALPFFALSMKRFLTPVFNF